MAETQTDSRRGSIVFARSGSAASGLLMRHCAGLGYWEWAFLIVSIINIALCVSLSMVRLVTVISGHDFESPDFVFTILLIVNSVFCAFYVVHGLLRELQFEIYMFICAAVFVIGYCIVEYCVNPNRRNPIKLARLIIGCIIAPINVALAFKIAQEFGWLEFRILGASQQMQNMYHQATLFESLLKFDLQAAMSFLLLVSVNRLTASAVLNLPALIILCVGLPFCFLLMFFGRTSMRREWRCVSWLFALLCLVAPAYVVYSIVDIYQDNGLQFINITIVIVSEYVIGSLTLLVRGILLIELYVVYRNFGKGLRERAFDAEANERTGLLAR